MKNRLHPDDEALKKLKYIIRPGTMVSRTDGDVHFISAEQLIALYQVNPSECVIVDRDDKIPKRLLHLEILAPRYDGKYYKPI